MAEGRARREIVRRAVINLRAVARIVRRVPMVAQAGRLRARVVAGRVPVKAADRKAVAARAMKREAARALQPSEWMR